MYGAIAALALVAPTAKCLGADEAENKVVRAIQKLDGSVKRDEKANAKPVIAVNLSGSTVTDVALTIFGGTELTEEIGPQRHARDRRGP